MKWNEGQQYENPPVGSHIARCYAVIDLGTQPHSYQGETKLSRDVRISFELPTELMTGKYNPETKGKPFSVHITVKQSLHPKSKLRPLLEGWRGKKFTKEDLEKFEPKKLVGLSCRVALVENGDYINVSSISPLSKTDKCPKLVNKPLFISLEPDEFNSEAFATLGEKTKEKISSSPEFAELSGGSQPDQESEHGHDGPPEGEGDPF